MYHKLTSPPEGLIHLKSRDWITMVFLMESSPTKLDDSQSYLWVTITHFTQRVNSGVG